MALMIEQTPGTAADVAAAVVDTYAARREQVQEIPLSDLVAGSVSADLSTITAVVAAASPWARSDVGEGPSRSGI